MVVLHAFLVFLFAVALHSGLCHARSRYGPIAMFLFSGGAVGFTFGATMIVLRFVPIDALTAILVYAFLCELYLFSFTLASGSVSASLLLLLATMGEASVDEIEDRYSSARMVANRLTKLQKSGFVERTESGSYGLTSRGDAAVRLCARLRRFFGHDRPSRTLQRRAGRREA